MNFGDDPFNRFSSFDPQSRLAQFRKRFSDFTNDNNNRSNNMFFDTNRHEWPNSRWRHVYDMAKGSPINDSHIGVHRKQDVAMNGEEEEGIPIKVIHETSRDNTPHEDRAEAANYCDAKSMDGSHTSNQSGSTSNSGQSGSHSNASHASNHSGSVFHQNESRSPSSPSNARSFEAKVSPRVRHIPIMVEPRDGSTSSGYTSDNVANEVIPNASNEKPVSRSSSRSSHNSHSSVARSPSPAKSVSSLHSNASNASKASSQSSDSAKSRIRQIPILVETKAETNEAPNIAEKPKVPTKAKPNGLAQSRPKTAKAAKSGPYVTRIPVVNESEAQCEQSKMQTSAEQNDCPAIQLINDILSELKNFEEKVNAFEGSTKDKNYRYLDEMLTRCMIRLDNIETEGREDIRKHRKNAIMAVQNCVSLLDSKLTNNELKNTRCEQMECTNSDPNTSQSTDSNNQLNNNINTNEEVIHQQSTVDNNATNEKMEVEANPVADTENVTKVNVNPNACPQQNETNNSENGCKQTIMVTSL